MAEEEGGNRKDILGCIDYFKFWTGDPGIPFSGLSLGLNRCSHLAHTGSANHMAAYEGPQVGLDCRSRLMAPRAGTQLPVLADRSLSTFTLGTIGLASEHGARTVPELRPPSRRPLPMDQCRKPCRSGVCYVQLCSILSRPFVLSRALCGPCLAPAGSIWALQNGHVRPSEDA